MRMSMTTFPSSSSLPPLPSLFFPSLASLPPSLPPSPPPLPPLPSPLISSQQHQVHWRSQ